MNRRLALSGLGSMVASIGLSACGDEGLGRLAAGARAKVAAVRSGDSVELEGGGTVRLAGIEAPYGQMEYAPEARAALSDLVLGQTVDLFYGGARQDPFGRTLAHLRLGRTGQWVQKAMLEKGAARVRTYADNRAMARPMLDAEARARAAKRGLWTLLAYRVRLPQEAAVDPFGFQLVEGRVSDVSDGGHGMTIDLEHWLSAQVAPSAKAQFAAAGLGAATLKGKLIRVRGQSRPASGEALMMLDHPEQVERLREA